MTAMLDDVTIPEIPHIEHRLGRFELDAPVQLATVEGTMPAVVRNVSIGGMFVALPRAEALGRHLCVRLSLPGQANPIEIGAEVRWSRLVPDGHRPTGMGLRFTVPLRDAVAITPVPTRSVGQRGGNRRGRCSSYQRLCRGTPGPAAVGGSEQRG